MKFGLFIPQGWRHDLVGIDPAQHWGAMAGMARRADGIEDWTSIWVYDHVHPVPRPTEAGVHEAWSLMAAFAGVTGRVRLGQMCTCMGYRNPAYLAKVAATVDVVSEGRLEMGIGAGWYEHEWRAYGYGFPGAGDRIAALREGVEVMRQMWTTGSAMFDGEHFRADGALCFPRPLQGDSLPGSRTNGIPMWVAGGGERKTLRVAAEYADYTNFSGMPDEFSHKSEVLEQHCRDIGRDVGEIVRSANFNVVIGRDEREVQERLAWIRDHYASAGLPDDVVESTVKSFEDGPLVGTPEQVVETLQDMERRGMTYAITYFVEQAYDLSGVQLFEREVLPELVDRERHGHLWHLLHGE
ncbi:TIGR03560 family F420-dependent LLM class oxidoreductase [Phycicoccus sp. CSK15P-2]|uniref:TIGR03560 family F420-dependent LLM class oxidoreductase n=1 Tax=Phycicoccus sp. CSK15P-2 TaxID=2807627 RepID=UPI00194F88EB|nr:TIGR03560 family F420-dependent LLM class oxidoreductase [Phycicoccus sp. CSK15P-2]MBM6402935.1 TIGR03560 family F420-dependent LLM class oxidoreductase [Phycicoccus sp. CSK15P-2]